MINDIFDICLGFSIVWFVVTFVFAVFWVFKTFRRIHSERKWLKKIGVKK